MRRAFYFLLQCRLITSVCGFLLHPSDTSQEYDINNHEYISIAYQSRFLLCLVNNRLCSDDRISTHRILLITPYIPTLFNAGALRILDIYSEIRKRYPHIQLDIFSKRNAAVDGPYEDYYTLFNHIYLSLESSLNPSSLITTGCFNGSYDVVDIQFHFSSALIKQFGCFGRKVIFTPMESLIGSYLLNKRHSLKNNVIMEGARSNAKEEEMICGQVDQVVCVSQQDANYIIKETHFSHITWLDTCLSLIEFSNEIFNQSARLPEVFRKKSVLFLAYFGSQTNREALLWYLNSVHPLVQKEVPDYCFEVVGKGDLSVFKKRGDKNINYIGYVSSVVPYIKNATLGIAPALSGTGFRGKINQYSLLSLPCVATSLAVKGLLYEHRVNICCTDHADAFAANCIQLLQDVSFNRQIGSAARDNALAHYCWSSKWDKIADIYELGNKE